MKGFFYATTTTLFCLFLAMKNDHRSGLRGPDAAVHSEVDGENHRSLQERTKDSVDPKLGTDLSRLYQNSLSSDATEVEYVVVDITFKSVLDNESAKEVLRPAVPVEFISCFQYMCSTRVPVSALKDISNIDLVQVLHTAKYTMHAGPVTTEGDIAILADLARTTFNVDGSGLLIGVVSNSYNCNGGAAADIASEDLPSAPGSIVILQDACPGNTDAGRAMMQLIHDVAPGARLAFRTGARGQADVAVGILELALAGCDVIVDDIIYFAEPMFQDGVIAQAVNTVVGHGIPYFSSAGNNARASWDAPRGFVPVTVSGRVLHQFGTNARGNPITRMSVTLYGRSYNAFIFQWDQPFGSVPGSDGSKSDIDIFLYFNGMRLDKRTDRNILSGDPYEDFEITVFDPAPFTFELEIELLEGIIPTYMRLIMFTSNVVTLEFATNVGTSYGHANAASAAGVGAAYYLQTPAYGIDPPEIEPFSSAGGVPIFFSKEGTRLASPEIRNQPRFTGPDGGVTTFFGDTSIDGKFRFFGTSASAPHVAAVAALMLQLRGGRRSLTPAQIYSTLEATAVDMDDPFTPDFDVGFDFGTGYGLVNAQAALEAACVITFDLFNALTNANVATLTNGVTIASPPPCGQANIEAVVPCGDSDGKVTIELYQGTKKIRKFTESAIPYFLFGNNGADVKSGKIKKGSYTIRAQVNGVWSPFTSFTLGGTCK